MVLAASCCCSADFRVFASAGAAVRLYTPQQKEHYRVLPFHPGFWYRNGCEMFFACQRSFGCGVYRRTAAPADAKTRKSA
ncbi:hypothetical protein ACUOFC_54770, partial [Escherichia sp. TWPC-MK]